jgi:hypothetical protein
MRGVPLEGFNQATPDQLREALIAALWGDECGSSRLRGRLVTWLPASPKEETIAELQVWLVGRPGIEPGTP